MFYNIILAQKYEIKIKNKENSEKKYDFFHISTFLRFYTRQVSAAGQSMAGLQKEPYYT